MDKEVLVSIKGIQYDEAGAQDPIEIITTGEYYLKNGKHYVLFEEMMEGSGAVTKSTLRFSDDEVYLKRSGVTQTQMNFDLVNKTLSNYATPFGNIVIAIDTKKIETLEKSDEISLNVDYDLDVNYEFLAECKLSVKISPRNKALNLMG